MLRRNHEESSTPRRSKSATVSTKKNNFTILNDNIYTQQQQLHQYHQGLYSRRSKSAMSSITVRNSNSSNRKHNHFTLSHSDNDACNQQQKIKQQVVLNRGKNRSRHLTCMTPCRPSAIMSDFKKKSLRKAGVDYFVKRQETPLNSHSALHSWEDVVLPQLSKETAFFIKQRFMENKTKSITTSSRISQNNIKRQLHNGHDNVSPCKRLFNLQYSDSSEPDYYILL